MNRGLSVIGLLIGSFVVIGVVVGVGYVVIEQMFSATSVERPAPQEEVEEVVRVVQPQPVRPTTATAPAEVKETIVQPKPTVATPAQTPTEQQKTGGFFVKKVPAGFVLDVTKVEPTLHLSVTTEPRAEDPAELYLCWTVVDPQDVVLSETDCWPLKKYGTWIASINYDHSLAPSSAGEKYYKYGHNMIKLRFDLVGPTRIQNADGPSPNTPTLGTGDTGVFDYYIPEGVQL